MYKYGRRVPKNAPSLKLHNFLTGVVPPHPPSVDYLSKLSNWQMLGNDKYGDCVAVTWANIRRLVTATLGDKEIYPSQEQVFTLYKTQNPNFPEQDEGMDIQTCLEYLVKVGGPDGVKALGFAKVDTTNIEEVNAAIGIFGCIWTGVYILSTNMDQFNQNKPWDYNWYAPREGGHSILTAGYNKVRAGILAGYYDMISWAKETSGTKPFWLHEAEEAWIVIWPEMLGTKEFLEGIDLQAFANAYKEITGKEFPVDVTLIPVPIPIPVPDPTPTPAPTPTTTSITVIFPSDLSLKEGDTLLVTKK